MIEINSLDVWPGKVQNNKEWGSKLCIVATIGNKQQLSKFNDENFFEKIINEILETEVNSLFAEQEEINTKKRTLVVDEEANKLKEINKELDKKLKIIPEPPKKAKTNETIDEWFQTFNKEGKKGNVGLVPIPLKTLYPNKAPSKLESSVYQYLDHFHEWLNKKNL